jgi:hypothetical protein
MVMKRVLWLFLATAVLPADVTNSNLKQIFEEHRWFDLRHAMTRAQGPALYRGAVAVAFNDVAAAERILHAVIRSDPRGDQARQAYDLLGSLYFRNGRYREFETELNNKWSGLDQPVSDGDRSIMAAFDHIPDLYVARLKPSVMRYPPEGDVTASVSIHNQSASFILDSDANVSVISESEARRLSLTIHEPVLAFIGADGSKAAGGRTALADRLFIGDVELRNVAFLVIGDDREPFVSLPPGKRGLLGLPILIALETIRWTHDGTLEVGVRSRTAGAMPNICFDGSDPITQIELSQRTLDMVLDTGADESEFWPMFAREFPGIAGQASKGSRDLTGLTGSSDVSALIVPQIAFRTAGYDVTLKDVSVLEKRTVPLSAFYSGRLALDILHQAKEVTIDLKALRIALK